MLSPAWLQRQACWSLWLASGQGSGWVRCWRRDALLPGIHCSQGALGPESKTCAMNFQGRTEPRAVAYTAPPAEGGAAALYCLSPPSNQSVFHPGISLRTQQSQDTVSVSPMQSPAVASLFRQVCSDPGELRCGHSTDDNSALCIVAKSCQ